MARKKPFPHLKQAKHKRRQFDWETREKIFKRDNYKCNLCPKDLKHKPKERVIDHKIPLDKYGSNRLDNLWLLCSECDQKKKNKLIEPAVNDYITKRIENLKRITCKTTRKKF